MRTMRHHMSHRALSPSQAKRNGWHAQRGERTAIELPASASSLPCGCRVLKGTGNIERLASIVFYRAGRSAREALAWSCLPER